MKKGRLNLAANMVQFQMATLAEPLESTATVVIEPWNVVLLNDEWHTFEDVIVQLLRATRCTLEQAHAITWEVHTRGEAVCYTGPRERCELVASILQEIDLAVRIEK